MNQGRNICREVKAELRSKNLQENFSIEKEKLATEVSKNAGICIFLSHKSQDKDFVKKVQSLIHEYGINTYLDEDDFDLQRAVSRSNDEKITESIQIGIENSTHIMCFASSQTVKSWWVPYEIGYADSKNKEIATLRVNDIKSYDVPSYLKIHEFLEGRQDLYRYIKKICLKETPLNGMYKYGSYSMDLILESLKKYVD